MKKYFKSLLLFASLMVAAVACTYDDGELWDKVNSLDERLTAIETQLSQINSDINSLSIIVYALQNNVYVASVDEVENGYKITFTDGKTVTITNGKDGADGKDGINGADGKAAPIISVDEFEGKYYWVQIIDGVKYWLTDKNGAKIPVTGENGVTPIMKVNAEGYWVISYDRGITFELLLDETNNPVKAVGKDGADGKDGVDGKDGIDGKDGTDGKDGADGTNGIDGDSFFSDVRVENGVLILVLADGTELRLPLETKASEFKSTICTNIEDPEVIEIINEEGTSMTFFGIKDEDGLLESITDIEIKDENNEISLLKLNPDGFPKEFIAPNNVTIEFTWLNENSTDLKIFNPEDNNYILTTWNLDDTGESKAPSRRSVCTRSLGLNMYQKAIDDFDSQTLPLLTRSNTGERDFDVIVNKCDKQVNAKVWLEIIDNNTREWITNVHDYKYITTGWYSFHIPSWSFPTKRTNEEICNRIDMSFHVIHGALTLAVQAGVPMFAAIEGALIATGIGAVPAGVAAAIGVFVGVSYSVTYAVDIAGGPSAFIKRFNPEWYYKEEYQDVFVIPHVDGKAYEKDGWNMSFDEDFDVSIVNLEGEPTISYFVLSPSHPAAGQSYIAEAMYSCVPNGSTIKMGIVGTDGYTNEVTQTVEYDSGKAELHVPGAATGVVDVCTITIILPTGEEISSKASLVFG